MTDSRRLLANVDAYWGLCSDAGLADRLDVGTGVRVARVAPGYSRAVRGRGGGGRGAETPRVCP